MIFASWGSLGRPLGGFLGRLGSFLDRLEAILGVSKLLRRPEASWCNLEPSESCRGPSGSFLYAGKEARTKKLGGRFSEDGRVPGGGSALITL